MGLQRKASKHSAASHEAVVSEDYADFKVGDRVDTVDGFLGTVTAVDDGPFPGTEQYEVTLDDDMGGGEYTSSQLTRVHTTQAAATGAAAEASIPVTAVGEHTAASDYPELADILVRRPPLAHSEPLRMSAAKRPEGATECSVCGGNGWLDVAEGAGEYGVPWERTTCTLCKGHGYLLPGEAKTAAAVDWDEVYEAYWCESCGFKGTLAPSTNGLDVCPKCGHAERAVNIDGNPFEFGLAASRDASISPEAEQGASDHVFFATAGLWDLIIDKAVGPYMKGVEKRMEPATRFQHDTGEGWSRDWCRFRNRRMCLFPKHIDVEGSREAGYAVFIPENRGLCPRDKWALQEACPIAQPGPHSGERMAQPEVKTTWRDGGQRGGRVWDPEYLEGYIQRNLTTDTEDRARQGLPPGREMDTGNINRRTSAFEFTAAWADVRQKARKIRSEGGIRIIAVPGSVESGLTITAEVKGDEHIYETTLVREPGKQSVASWACGCAWAAYSWGRSGRWKKFEGRMCSHALALTYEAQAKGMFGKGITEQREAPAWRTSEPVSQYVKNPLGLAASLRPVCLDADLAPAPAALIAQAMLQEGKSRLAVLAAFGDDSIVKQAMVMDFPDLKALVRGNIRTVRGVVPEQGIAIVEGLGEVPVRDIVYPTYHPTKGLVLTPNEARLSMESALRAEAEMVDIGEGRDVGWGHLNWGSGEGEMLFARAFGDPPPGDEPEAALPVTTGEDDSALFEDDGDALGAHLFASLTSEARGGFDVPDAMTPEEAGKYLIGEAQKHANFVTDLLRRVAKEHGCRMDGETFRVKKLPRTVEKIKQAMVKFHLRADQAAEQFQDALRFTMVVPTQVYGAVADEVLDDLGEKGIRPMARDLIKNYWLKGDPYDGLNTVLILPDGFPFELQFHTDASLDLKLHIHEMYDEFRGDKGPVTRERKKFLWDTMVRETYALERPVGLDQVGTPQRHVFASVRTETYYAFKDVRKPGEYRGVFRKIESPDDIDFERWSNSRGDWVEDITLAAHLVKGDPTVDTVSKAEADVIIRVTRDLEGQAILDRLVQRTAAADDLGHLQAEAMVVDALADPATAPEMAEAIGESLIQTPPGPGDQRLAWLMGGSTSSPSAAGASTGSPATASDGDIAGQAKAFLAKQALKEFTPAEQQEIINEGLDVQASNLSDLDIAGTHYEALEAALASHEDDEDWLT